jgi:glycosyltransferase involved in cell wall biosynthesis
VIIPCRNAAGTIGSAVSTALAQTNPPLEVIVVDDASTDDSAAIANAAGAQVMRLVQRSNAGGARNYGIDVARGSVLAFLDADVKIAPDWLQRVDDAFRLDPAIGAVGGRVVNGRPGLWGDLDHFLNHSEWISGRQRMCGAYPTMAIAYRREAIGSVRFPATNYGEDIFFALAVQANSWRILYDPHIRIEHCHERLDVRQFWKRQLDAGKALYVTRRSLDRPGKILFRAPLLLFLFPHLWIVIGRMLRQRMIGKVIALFPWLVVGEVARIVGFFQARRVARRSDSLPLRQTT